MSQPDKVIKYRRPIHINIGAIIFVILFLYLMINVVIYLGKDHIAIYEVTAQSIADDSTVTGLILREEEIFYTDTAGYINYYYNEGSHVSKNSTVYTLDESGQVADILSSMETNTATLKEDSERVRLDIADYLSSYTDSNFYNIYNYNYNLNSTALEIVNQSRMSQLNEALASLGNAGTFSKVRCTETGLISYIWDGMEDLTTETLTPDDFDKSTYKDKRNAMRSTEATPAGAPVYKLIYGDDWSIVVPLTDSLYESIKEKEYLKIRFTRDDVNATVSVSLFEIDGEHYAQLGLTKHLVRYYADRYVEIEMILNTAKGLKIPISSVVEKDFYVVPSSFVSQNEEGKTGIYLDVFEEEKQENIKTFVPLDVFYESQDQETMYLDPNDLEAGETLLSPTSGETFYVGELAKLQGVYNVNKGYYVFRRVEILYENEEYYIISGNTSYGLSAFDHIIVDGSKAKEDDIIF